MTSKVIRIAATLIALQLIIGVSVANAFDDDFIKLQQQQFKLQQQQFKLQRQLMDQQFKMQRQQLRMQDSYSTNLYLNSPSSWIVSPSFDPMIDTRSQIRMSELNMNMRMSDRFASELLRNYGPDAAYIRAGTSVARTGLSQLGKLAAREAFKSYADLANTYRSGAAMAANRIADTYRSLAFNPSPIADVYAKSPAGIYAPRYDIGFNEMRQYRDLASKLSQPNIDAYTNAARAYRAYTTASTIMNTVLTAAQQFYKTIDYVGTSMQIMNPPIYLNEKTSWGSRGFGSYSLPDGTSRYWQESLRTADKDFITRRHTDTIFTPFRTYSSYVETKIIPTNSFERFMLHHYPVNDYWDESATVTSMRSFSGSWRETTVRGVTTISPLTTSNINQNFGSINNMSYPSNLNSTIYQPNFNSISISQPILYNNTIYQPRLNSINLYQPKFYNSPIYQPSFNNINLSQQKLYNTTYQIDTSWRRR
jgi:hypothetical protein